LIIPALVSQEVSVNTILEILVEKFGPIDTISPPIDFDFTDYYGEEMGTSLTRYLVSFLELVDPETLPEIKLYTNELESRFSLNGSRTINLDPGLLSLERLILASTKNNGRRIPLRDGIYAEITLVYHHGDFHETEWTYPDYCSREYREILTKMRIALRGRLR
jgi:hypothetical protein